MKKRLFFLVIIICHLTVQAQKQKSDLEKMDLHGKVKEVKRSQFKVSYKNGTWIKGEPVFPYSITYDKDYNAKKRGVVSTDFAEVYTYTVHNQFTNKGNFSEITFYDGKKFSGNYLYLYNNDDKLVEVKAFDKNKDLAWIKNYSYDSNLNLKEVHSASNGNYNGGDTYEYDSQGNMIKKVLLKRNKKPLTTYVYEYNDKKEKQREKQYNHGYGNADEDTLISDEQYVYIYNADKVLVEKHIKDEKGSLKEKIRYNDKEAITAEYLEHNGTLVKVLEHIYTYNEKGYLISETTLKYNTTDNRLYKKITDKYIVDDKGNWIKKYRLVDDKTEGYMLERQIIYF